MESLEMTDKKKPEAWQADAEKLGGEALVEKIFEICDAQNDILHKFDSYENRLTWCETHVKRLYKAFPGRDVDGHRRYHELIIEKTEETRKLRVAIEEKTISGLIWSGIILIAMSVWHFILANVKAQ